MTVQLAFQAAGPVPSAQTLTALVSALRLRPVEELLALQRVAAGSGNGERPGPGRPIGQWDPYALEVHPASTVQDGSGLPEQQSLPGYVPREHDLILAEAVREAGQGHSRMLVLVGESSTGKTRACWEAVQPLAEPGWRLWHPFDPTRAEAALEDLHRVGTRTVVWLNEAQHYLGDRASGERIAAAVHDMLTSPQRGPVLVLATLWPDYFKQYTALPAPGEPDSHSRVRELLAGRTVSVPNAFDTPALAAATALAEGGDRLLADALTRARADGRLTQDLAGGPALLERYQAGNPAAKALLEAAMDARRLGVGLHLPQAFLTDAAPDYLHDTDWNQLTDDWAERAYAELARHVHGKQAPLSRVTPRPQRRPPGSATPADAPSPRPAGPVFRLADYLDQYGRTTRRHLCPPASFWHAAHTHVTHPDDLDKVTEAAEDRHRLQWAHHLLHRAADHGSTRALHHLAVERETTDWDWDLEDAFYRQAAFHGNTRVLSHPNPSRLARMRERAGDREGAEAIARQAADHGNTNILHGLAGMREEAGDQEGAEALYRQAVDHGDTNAMIDLALMREEAGDQEGAEALYRQAAEHGDTEALSRLAGMREEAGDREGAETLYRQAADHGMAGQRPGGEVFRRRWPYGLDPDGTPTPQWQKLFLGF
ncbi:tetratricopeptide repeat protein [Streptomyces sp. NPDC002835]